ncbi:MAG: cyclic nucleotide-binding domain-containing protein [Nitrospinae bacterium]|nr:cyclic nucleotide-binding domain-containing protein [Nitrospinota bacterium]
MATENGFKIHRRQNFRVLEVNGFDTIVFGCPPGIVKEFSRRKEDLPLHYMIPIRTFVKGRNNFDFEFIIYSFLFFRKEKQKINIYCTRQQKARFKTILNETLFGPRFKHLLQAQFRRFCNSEDFSVQDFKKMDEFLDKVAGNKALSNLFDKLLREHTGDRVTEGKTAEFFSKKIRIPTWLVRKKIKNLEKTLARNYLVCAQLRKEMELFGLVTEKGRNRFIGNVVDFHLFDKDQAVYIAGLGDKRKKLKIVQRRPSAFEVLRKSEKICTIDISHLDMMPRPVDIEPLQRPYMGVTFLGVGSGFAHNREDSCLIAWSEGKGIMVDAFSDSTNCAMKYGVTDNDIVYMFLTHVHSDHDSGLAEKILSGQRTKVISTRIIFESFLRKLEAITCFPQDVVEGFIDFLEVEPHKKTKLPGFKNTYFTFDYSLHSIPAGRCRLSYKDAEGNETTLSHSGDTKYDVDKINKWYEEGMFSKKRRDQVLGFVWDADLIIHDVGGGTLHTELKSLEKIDDELARKIVLVHQHYDPVPHPRLKFAVEGETIVLIQDAPASKGLPHIEAIKNVVLFKDLKNSDLLDMLNHSEVVKYQQDEYVFSQNDEGNDCYVILDGFAEIIIDGKPFAVYEKGKFFGELAITTNNPRRRASIRAKIPLTLLKIPRQVYKQFNLPLIQDDFYKIRNYFNDVMHPSLLASLAFGKIIRWSKDEDIFPS